MLAAGAETTFDVTDTCIACGCTKAVATPHSKRFA
jgi:hypothetical protein